VEHITTVQDAKDLLRKMTKSFEENEAAHQQRVAELDKEWSDIKKGMVSREEWFRNEVTEVFKEQQSLVVDDQKKVITSERDSAVESLNTTYRSTVQKLEDKLTECVEMLEEQTQARVTMLHQNVSISSNDSTSNGNNDTTQPFDEVGIHPDQNTGHYNNTSNQ